MMTTAVTQVTLKIKATNTQITKITNMVIATSSPRITPSPSSPILNTKQLSSTMPKQKRIMTNQPHARNSVAEVRAPRTTNGLWKTTTTSSRLKRTASRMMTKNSWTSKTTRNSTMTKRKTSRQRSSSKLVRIFWANSTYTTCDTPTYNYQPILQLPNMMTWRPTLLGNVQVLLHQLNNGPSISLMFDIYWHNGHPLYEFVFRKCLSALCYKPSIYLII